MPPWPFRGHATFEAPQLQLGGLAQGGHLLGPHDGETPGNRPLIYMENIYLYIDMNYSYKQMFESLFLYLYSLCLYNSIYIYIIIYDYILG